MGARARQNRPARGSGLAALFAVVCLWAVAPALAATEGRLELDAPSRSGQHLVVDVALYGLFDDEISTALRSGAPANLHFHWTIWQERAGWRDRKILDDDMRYRIYFDVLEEDYNVFDAHGRPLTACDALDGVEDVVCNQEHLVLGDINRFSPAATYYVEMTVEIEIVAEQQVRGLENWLAGRPQREDDDVPVEALPEVDDTGLTSDLSGATMGLIKSLAGIKDRNLSARSPTFRGWRSE